jgi:hypothetical protein
VQVLNFVPEVRDGRGQLRPPSEFKTLFFGSGAEADAVMCVMNSSLFRWYLDVTADGSHLNKREVCNFPLDPLRLADLFPKLSDLSRRLSIRLEETSFHRTMKYKHDTLTVQCIVPKNGKSVIDEIDDILGQYYEMTELETDFIKNFDIKFRVGSSEAAA